MCLMGLGAASNFSKPFSRLWSTKLQEWSLQAGISLSTAGGKINFFSSSHLAPKYFKVVANSKKLVAIKINTQKTSAMKNNLHELQQGH